MKTIGLLGGMSWESTIPYYRLINEGIKQRLGGLHSAQVLLHSVDFHEIEECQRRGEWDKTGDILAEAALGLQRAGAEGIVLCTNTMHKVADAIESRCSLPFLHIADATGRAITGAGMTRVALLGTRYTMEQDLLALQNRAHRALFLAAQKLVYWCQKSAVFCLCLIPRRSMPRMLSLLCCRS